MRVLSIVGARPQFIKAAVLSEELQRQGIEEVLVHTGQHYDTSMSDVFFKELPLPSPAYQLAVGSAPHGAQTGLMMERLEPVLLRESPDWTIVYGDTNTTLAGALVAAKMRARLAHVEAGLRSFDRAMPEEINRIVADHVADLLFAPNERAAAQLASESLSRGTVVTGDLMIDLALRVAATLPAQPEVLSRFGLTARAYGVATVHRAANTDDQRRFAGIIEGLRRAGMPILFPVHPRTSALAREHAVGEGDNIRVCEPLAYAEMLALTTRAATVFTDSGGLQKEAVALHVRCVTLRDETEWTETLERGWNVLAGSDPEAIARGARRLVPAEGPRSLADGAAARMVEALVGRARKSEADDTPHARYAAD